MICTYQSRDGTAVCWCTGTADTSRHRTPGIASSRHRRFACRRDERLWASRRMFQLSCCGNSGKLGKIGSAGERGTSQDPRRWEVRDILGTHAASSGKRLWYQTSTEIWKAGAHKMSSLFSELNIERGFENLIAPGAWKILFGWRVIDLASYANLNGHCADNREDSICKIGGRMVLQLWRYWPSKRLDGRCFGFVSRDLNVAEGVHISSWSMLY